MKPISFFTAGIDMTATSRQSLLLWSTSWLTGYSSYIAYQRNLPDLSTASGCVFITSLLYWKQPQRNWVRTLDISVSVLGILYHLWRSGNTDKSHSYRVYVLGIMLLYPYSWYLYHQKKYWTSFLLHATMHILGNQANLYLYETLEVEQDKTR